MGTFSAVGVSPDFFVVPGNSLLVTITNTFVATVVIERAISGAYVPLYTITGDQVVALPIDGTFRLNCTDYTSGTVTYALASQAPANPYLPPGGTTGQALEKTSDAAGVADWETVVGSGLFGAKTIVVSTGGNDAAGTASKYAAEFLTIAAALAAAASGDTIVIRPGTYNSVALVLKDGVNFYFLPGATVTSLNDDYIFNDNGVACQVVIGGYGTLGDTGGTVVLRCAAASHILLEGKTLTGPGGIIVLAVGGNPTITVRVSETISAPSSGNVVGIGGGAPTIVVEAAQSITGTQILIDSGSTGATRVSMNAPTITATGAGVPGVYVQPAAPVRVDIAADLLVCGVLFRPTDAAAEMHVVARSHRSHAGSGVNALSIQHAGRTFYRCDECVGIAGAQAGLYLQDTAELHVLGGRILGLNASASGHAILASGATCKLRLYPGTVLIAGDDAATESINTDSTPTVLAMGAIAVNKAANIAVTVAVGSLLVDAAVV